MKSSKFTSTPLFPRQALVALLLPLIAEQALSVTIGLADTLMVSSVGEAAVSGVSLVDSFNTLMIQIMSALATGGAVVTRPVHRPSGAEKRQGGGCADPVRAVQFQCAGGGSGHRRAARHPAGHLRLH